MLKNFRVIDFRGFHYPQKFFSNEIFPDYGISSSLMQKSGLTKMCYYIGFWQIGSRFIVGRVHSLSVLARVTTKHINFIGGIKICCHVAFVNETGEL